jgi:hypothetical protein
MERTRDDLLTTMATCLHQFIVRANVERETVNNWDVLAMNIAMRDYRYARGLDEKKDGT